MSPANSSEVVVTPVTLSGWSDVWPLLEAMGKTDGVEDVRSRFTDLVEREDHLLIAAYIDGTVVGYAWAQDRGRTFGLAGARPGSMTSSYWKRIAAAASDERSLPPWRSGREDKASAGWSGRLRQARLTFTSAADCRAIRARIRSIRISRLTYGLLRALDPPVANSLVAIVPTARTELAGIQRLNSSAREIGE